MPYGPSVPHMFIVVFVIMLPIYLATRPDHRWTFGLRGRSSSASSCWSGVHRAVHRKYSAAGRHARHPGRHLDRLHLEAPAARCGRRCGSRCRLYGDHPDRLLHRPEAAGATSRSAGGAAGRHRDRLDRRLHVHTDVVAAAQNGRALAAVVRPRPARRRSVQCGAAAGHRIPLASTTSTEGMANVESAARPRATTTTCARSFGRRRRRDRRLGHGLPFPPAVYIGHPGWKRRAAAPATRWRPGCSSP